MAESGHHRGKTLRVVGGCLTTVAAVAVLVRIGTSVPTTAEEDLSFAWVGIALAAVAVLYGVLLVIGWSNGRAMTLTRARWRYGYAPVVLLMAAAATWYAVSTPTLQLLGGASMLVGNAFFMLFAPDTAPDWARQVTTGQRKRWRQIMIVLWMVVALCVPATVLAIHAGHTTTVASLVLIGLLCLAFSVLIAVQLTRLRLIMGKEHR